MGMNETASPPAATSAAVLLGLLLLCFAVAGAGGFATAEGVRTWYPTLDKPPWTPPNWLFGPVWTVLYAAMAVAAWNVWRQAEPARGALGLWALQLVLNAGWSPLFFGLQRLDLALVDIAALWLAIAATIAAFWTHSRLSAGLLVPYLVWVSYAGALNFRLWQLNG